ncbi:MAG: NTP transferase domain-containing protein [Oscillospiraceae bacterium]|nr:NTP transferase domain-containing protein [Oscillospiraceae bacterium]
MKKTDFLIPENEDLTKAMRAINLNTHGIVFLKDFKNRVKASLTDGDIRRYLLKSNNLSIAASRIANYNFMYIKKHEILKSKEIILKSKINCLPVLDENHDLISIALIDKILKFESIPALAKSDTPVIIMAGGKGSRLKNYSNILPKPLIPIGNYTITERIIENFREFNYDNFYMIINHKKNLIKAYFSELNSNYKIKFIEEAEPLGTGGGLKLLESVVDKTFFITNCDITIDESYIEIYDYHKKQQNMITLVCVKKNINLPYGIIKIDEKNNVRSIEEKPNIPFVTNTGFYVIEPEFLDFITKNEPIDITDVIKKCIDSNKKVGVYRILEDLWQDMGQPKNLEKMVKLFYKTDSRRYSEHRN